MAERNPPAWLQDGSHPADLDRRILESVFRTEGVLDLSGGDLLVTEQAAPSMGVTVAAGVAVIAGTESTSQGLYHVVNDADVDLAIAAADPTNPRIDLVIARVYDSFYGTAVTDEWALEVVTGTPAASPSEPAVPDNSHVLARVDVGASPFSAVTNAQITDRRELAVAGDGGLRAVVTFTSSGTFDKADYPWLRAAKVTVVGGGAGGGGAQATVSGESATGGGGGAGAFCSALLDVDDLAASETVTVGTGGPGGTGAGSGTDGGDSSFGSHIVCEGGNLGGDGNNTSGNDNAGGGPASAVTTAPANALSVPGGSGGGGRTLSGSSVPTCHGGGNPLAPPAHHRLNSFTGVSVDGNYPGGGGSGCVNGFAQPDGTGGDGADGVVIVELYG